MFFKGGFVLLRVDAGNVVFVTCWTSLWLLILKRKLRMQKFYRSKSWAARNGDIAMNPDGILVTY